MVKFEQPLVLPSGMFRPVQRGAASHNITFPPRLASTLLWASSGQCKGPRVGSFHAAEPATAAIMLCTLQAQLRADSSAPLWPDPEDGSQWQAAAAIPPEKFLLFPDWLVIGWMVRGNTGYWEERKESPAQQVGAHGACQAATGAWAQARRVGLLVEGRSRSVCEPLSPSAGCQAYTVRHQPLFFGRMYPPRE